jgi:predicted acyltransferase
MSEEAGKAPNTGRIQSLDQYRGYAIFGMLLVNFFGHYDTEWVEGEGAFNTFLEWAFGKQLHHHGEFMTYADTIAPIFMFVVGIGMRLSWINRIKHMEPGPARKGMAKRYFTLVLIAFAIYTGWLWDALMSIGLAGLVSVLIVDKKWPVRVAYALGLIVAFQLIFSFTSYGEWLLRMGKYGRDLDWPFITTFLPLRGDLLSVQINGGLIGHWGWAFMLIMGTIAYDIMRTQDRKKILTGLSVMGVVLAIAGWSVKCIGTQNYYSKAEPYIASMIMTDYAVSASAEYIAEIKAENPGADETKLATLIASKEQQLSGKARSNVNTIVRKSPGILESTFKDNEEALVAIQASDWNKLKEVGVSTLTNLAANAPEETPRTANAWVFSKNYVTMPFPLWAGALCVFHLLAFYIIVDILGINIPMMKVVGLNPLAIYIFQCLTLEMFSNFQDYTETAAAREWLPGFLMNTFAPGRNMEETTSAFIVFGSFVLYWGFIYLVARRLYTKNIIIKI